MKKSLLGTAIVVFCCGATVSSQAQSNANINRRGGGTPEVKLAASTRYPSGTTQTLTFNVNNLNDSQGLTVTSDCEVKGAAQKAGPNTYKIAITIPPKAEDGNCYLGVTSNANKAHIATDIDYAADPNYWKKTAPDLSAFANSKTWTYMPSSGKTQIQKAVRVEKSARRLSVMTTGAENAMSAFGLTPPNKISGVFAGCILEGTISKNTATLKPLMNSEPCKQVGTLAIKVAP